MTTDDLERLRAGYAAFNRGDYEAVVRLLRPEFVLRDREEVPDPQTYEGLDEAVTAFVSVRSDFDDYWIEPVEMVEGDGWVVVTARQSGRGKVSGVPVTGDVFHLWRIADGRATGLAAFSTRDEALAAAEASS